jgi:hypothetical protein
MLYLGFYGDCLSTLTTLADYHYSRGMTHRFVWWLLNGMIFSPSGNRVIQKMPEFDKLRELCEGVRWAMATWLFTKNKQVLRVKS